MIAGPFCCVYAAALCSLLVDASGPKPIAEDWAVHEFPSEDRGALVRWLLGDGRTGGEVEYQSYDGFYNNLARPDLGAVDTPLLRRTPARYADGVYQPVSAGLPNPLDLSSRLMSGPAGSASHVGRSALLVFFGQQVVEEILDAQRPACPPEYVNVPVPEGHPYRKEDVPHAMPVLRTRYDARTGQSPNNPRQQLNEITPWLDGGLVYGTSRAWSDVLRRNDSGHLVADGMLAASDETGRFPARNTQRLPMANPPPPKYHHSFVQQQQTQPVDRFYKLGNPRGNENPFLLSFGVLWFRWHNLLAKELRNLHPYWTSEKIYNEARRWVIATQQHLVVNKWLPRWLGMPLPPYAGYDPSVDPQIDQLFQGAAFRFGHTLVTAGVYVRDYARNNCNLGLPPTADRRVRELVLGINGSKAVRTCQHYWRPHESVSSLYDHFELDVDRLLMGMALQPSEAEDTVIVEDLRERVFGPLEFSRRDLMALNIQRGRDHGLPTYNDARVAFNLSKVTDVSHFPTQVQQALMDLYNNSLDQLDVWVGGLLETTQYGPGELFTAIISDQFRRIRDGDRFWYANRRFTKEEVQRIEELEVYDVIVSVTRMNHNDIQKDPFRVPYSASEVAQQCQRNLVEGTCLSPSPPATPSPCWHLPPLRTEHAEACSPAEGYDYFTGSHMVFVITFLSCGLLIVVLVASVWLLGERAQQHRVRDKQACATSSSAIFQGDRVVPFAVREWVQVGSPMREVLVALDDARRQIRVLNHRGQLLRAVDVAHAGCIHVFIINDGLHLMLRVQNDYDLVLKFEAELVRASFLQALEQFVFSCGVARERVGIGLQPALKQAVTRKDRQRKLEKFFRTVFSQAFNINNKELRETRLSAQAVKEVVYTEITIDEFAEALSLRSDSEFVQKMFALVDKDRNGFISFREFLDMLIIFSNGTAEDKVKLLFDMYDINGKGELTRDDFKNMIKSLIETSNTDVDPEQLHDVITSMMRNAGLENKEAMTARDFQQLLMEHKDQLGYTHLNFPGLAKGATPDHRKSLLDRAYLTAHTMYECSGSRQPLHKLFSVEPGSEEEALSGDALLTEQKDTDIEDRLPHFPFFENYAREIFWLTLYTLVLLAIFAERAYYYSVEREHTGLRRIAGYGVSITRGAASAMMFSYSSLLVTMCRNTITCLRGTLLHLVVPFDRALEMHKYIAMWALFFTVLHVIGHGFNLYCISTQPADDVACLFRNFFHSTHELPTFARWCWGTITGVSGVVLTALTAFIYIFSTSYARQHLFNAFWIIHSLYPLFYALIILHGTGRLIQEPFMGNFLAAPLALFTVDKLITLTVKKVEVPILRAELLPSDVTMLEFKKPSWCEFRSGQWLRLACPALHTSEYHPFTISSAPHEPHLTTHIRAVGPWTNNLRALIEDCLHHDKPLPKVHMEGPYGEVHQDWYHYDVSVLIGGGIGVTPFASILKDIVFRANTNQQYSGCRKVYFLWVTQTQKHFEWLVDIVREVERADTSRIVWTHIFITQFYHKFDLRTILLYICERHFQRVCGRSLFTGLQAVTHFGRPDFPNFFESLKTIHSKVRKVGVFSCGPPPMTLAVDKVCAKINQQTHRGPIFQHHFKNF